MSVTILGGLDRLKRTYQQTGSDLGINVKFFGQRVPNMGKRIGESDAIVLLTGTVSHAMVQEAVRIAKRFNIPVGRTHSSGVSALKRCLMALSNN